MLSCDRKKPSEKDQNDNIQLSETKVYKTIGLIERTDPRMSVLFAQEAKIEVIAEGFEWVEGPVWASELNALLFSDVKENKVYKWTEEDSVSAYLEPSGFTGDSTNSREKGSNGLATDSYGHLVLCQHGDRRIARMLSTLDKPKSTFETIVSEFDGKQLNSPNDLVFDKKGNLYFTDPPYGLSDAMLDDPDKELDFQGVYRLSADERLTLLTQELEYPNGIALSLDNKSLYVSNSQDRKALWMKYPIQESGELGEGIIFYDASTLIGKEAGYPDGIEVDSRGFVYTAGPGGLWVFDSDGVVIGKIRSGDWISNCTFDEKEETLYITADDKLLRVKLKG